MVLDCKSFRTFFPGVFAIFFGLESPEDFDFSEVLLLCLLLRVLWKSEVVWMFQWGFSRSKEGVLDFSSLKRQLM